jgi:phenylalanyl-tRNA synthetase beta subunit
LEYLYVIKHGNIDIGFGGEIRGMQYAEIDLELILGQEKTQLAKLWPKYPPQIEDITFEIPEKTNIGDIIKNIKSIKNVEMAELVTKYNNAYTFRVWYQSKQKTFTDKEVEVVRNKILKKVESKFGGVVKS